jgi:hypothetical protein
MIVRSRGPALVGGLTLYQRPEPGPEVRQSRLTRCAAVGLGRMSDHHESAAEERVWAGEQESLERSWVPVDKSAAAAEGRVWEQESLEPPDTHARAEDSDGSKCMVETAVNASLSHGARREDGSSWGGECVCGPQCVVMVLKISVIFNTVTRILEEVIVCGQMRHCRGCN